MTILAVARPRPGVPPDRAMVADAILDWANNTTTSFDWLILGSGSVPALGVVLARDQ